MTDLNTLARNMDDVQLNGQTVKFRGLTTAYDRAEYAKLTDQDVAFLNQFALIGFTDQRGFAWHYDETLQGAESNHYPGAIPVEDVLRRLFAWHAVEVEQTYDFKGQRLVAPKKAFIADDNGQYFNDFKSAVIHQYDEWLVNKVAALLNGGTGLGIASAALIKNRAAAFVQIQLPETISTTVGFDFRPLLGAHTALDGSLASTYNRGFISEVCGNTTRISLLQEFEKIRIKHTKNSELRVATAQQALNLITIQAEDTAKTIEALASVDVTLQEWQAFLDEYAPVPTEVGRSRTIAENRRNGIDEIYNLDPRAATWKGTALGVTQATNTWNTWERSVKKVSRVERQLSDFVFGRVEEDDNNALETLDKVTSGRITARKLALVR
jgi:phage/plasmid-like protein (TIGR03299 family)